MGRRGGSDKQGEYLRGEVEIISGWDFLREQIPQFDQVLRFTHFPANGEINLIVNLIFDKLHLRDAFKNVLADFAR